MATVDAYYRSFTAVHGPCKHAHTTAGAAAACARKREAGYANAGDTRTVWVSKIRLGKEVQLDTDDMTDIMAGAGLRTREGGNGHYGNRGG